jgi:hypothetical protein
MKIMIVIKNLLLLLLVTVLSCNERPLPKAEVNQPQQPVAEGNQPQQSVAEVNQPAELNGFRMEGPIDDIMEQVRARYPVSYSFAYDANRISKQKYSITLPINATIEEAIDIISSATKQRLELKGNVLFIYEK